MHSGKTISVERVGAALDGSLVLADLHAKDEGALPLAEDLLAGTVGLLRVPGTGPRCGQGDEGLSPREAGRSLRRLPAAALVMATSTAGSLADDEPKALSSILVP